MLDHQSHAHARARFYATAVLAALAIIAFSVFASFLFNRVGAPTERTCFQSCDLQRVGRELSNKGLFYLVERCPVHGRTFLEPVTEEIWMEMRSNGVPELRTSAGMWVVDMPKEKEEEQ